MAKLTQKQLIGQIRELKDIKPRKEWAVLLKSQLLAEKKAEIKIPAQQINIFQAISSVLFERKLAYAFAAVMVLVAGIGFCQFAMPGAVSAPVAKQPALKENVVAFNTKVINLAQVTKQGRKEAIPLASSEIKAKAQELAKDLKDNPKDPQTIKDITASLKTLASVQGNDLSENADVKGLYQAIVEAQIEDLAKATLTAQQKGILTEAEKLYKQEKYVDALEQILLINK